MVERRWEGGGGGGGGRVGESGKEFRSSAFHLNFSREVADNFSSCLQCVVKQTRGENNNVQYEQDILS